MDVLVTHLAGLPKFFGYFAAALAMLSVFGVLYTKTTSYNDMELIGRGNMAAAYSLGGSLLGFSLPLASAAMHTVSAEMFVIWGVTAMLAQLMVYFMAKMIMPGLQEQMEVDNRAYGLLLGGMAVAVGVLNAGCVA